MAEKAKVAFVCVHNSCRSQMAEHNATHCQDMYDKQVHEPFLHSNIGDINTPDLIWAHNIEISKKIRADILSMIALTKIGLGIDGANAHNPHHSADLLAVN